MKHKSLFIASPLAAVLVLTQCSTSQEPKENNQVESIPSIDFNAKALSTLQSNCLSCHADAGPGKRIAPPFSKIKQQYAQHFDGEEAFINGMSTFLSAPKPEDALMKRAIDKHGLMPNLGMDEATYKGIAAYIYHADLAAENWSKEALSEAIEAAKKNQASEPINYLAKGKELALSTKGVLGKNLLQAIKSKGSAGALEFCNTRAIPITDSMSMHLNAEIKRVSDRNRNPNNAANAQELEYIMKAKEELAQSGKITPQLLEQNGKKIGYYPIVTNDMCLQCHGEADKDINENTLLAINTHYPEDKATGYEAEQLRGIWVVIMSDE